MSLSLYSTVNDVPQRIQIVFKSWYLLFCKPPMKCFDHGTDLPSRKLFPSVGYCCFCCRSEHNFCGVDFTPKITIRREEKSRQRREEKRAMSGKFLPSLLYPPSPTAHFAWLCFLFGTVSKFLYVDFVFEFQGDTSLDYQAKCPNHAKSRAAFFAWRAPILRDAIRQEKCSFF